MKKTIVMLLAMSGMAIADTTVLDLTWAGPDNGTWNDVNNWVVTGTEDHPTSIPEYTNTTESIYRLNDGAKVSAENVSIGNLNGKLIAGDNVSFGGNWAVIFKDVEIGKNFTWSSTSGDGIKFITGKGYTVAQGSTANTLKLNSVYSATNNIITTLGTGSSIDFCTDGKIVCTANDNTGTQTCLGQYSAGNPRALTLSAQIESVFADEAGVQDRVLIEAPYIWYRDLNNVYRDDMFDLTLTSLDGETLVKYDSVMDPNAAWTINGVETAMQQGAYRSYATSAGIGVQYYVVVPEPATATLSLLALAGLAARRRRH